MIPEFGLFVSPLLRRIGRKLDLSMASKHATEQYLFDRPLAARAVLVAAKMIPKRRSTIAFCCELFGALEEILVPFAANSLRSPLVLCSLALSQ